MSDITLSYTSEGWSFQPHSKKADDFLFFEFGQVGERDLNAQDVDVICRRASRRGLVIADLSRFLPLKG